MSILKHLDKNNLHHAYLIEGKREQVVSELVEFLKESGINTVGSSDFININVDCFKIDDARNLKSYGAQKSFSTEKKIFIISINSFLLEAQNSLLKMFEEPIENTHFFLILPDASSLLKTFISRFYFISTKQDQSDERAQALKFIAMPIKNRIDFIKELLAESEEEDSEGNEIVALDSTRAKALKFLNALELTLHNKISKGISDFSYFDHIFKVREFLRMPGSSAKSLMESVALIVPSF